MNNLLQITYWTIGGFEGQKPVRQALEDAKACGYAGLELAFGAGELNTDTTEATCRAIRDEAQRVGMAIATMATGAYWGCSLSSRDPAQRKAAIAFTRKYIQVAGWLGIKTILVIPGAVDVPWDPSVPVTPYQEAWDNATASLRELLPVAAENDVTLALENVWNRFLLGPIEFKMFIDQFASRYVGSYFDVGNVVITGYAQHWIEILGPRIAAVHVKNFRREDCAGGLHGFGDDLLSGDVDFAAVRSALEKIQYTGPITAEMLPFCRLPNMTLPDMDLARDTAVKLKRVFAES
ncbi:MAG: sugar phosphate isomerase/epimerase [Thermoguttaceae bacterium]|jgi:hexulose-6-phosphate isomerase|nr:sugar phosphate isomerase/epimerase [Thermoguttaceae bacterium]